jgi:hypothetical protein
MLLDCFDLAKIVEVYKTCGEKLATYEIAEQIAETPFACDGKNLDAYSKNIETVLAAVKGMV